MLNFKPQSTPVIKWPNTELSREHVGLTRVSGIRARHRGSSDWLGGAEHRRTSDYPVPDIIRSTDITTPD